MVLSDDNEETWNLADMILWHNGSDYTKRDPNFRIKVIRISGFSDWLFSYYLVSQTFEPKQSWKAQGPDGHHR